jgi:hypothetical protein
MSNARWLVLVLALSAASFLGVRWIGLGAPIPFLQAAPAGSHADGHTAADPERDLPASTTAARGGVHVDYYHYNEMRYSVSGDNPLPMRRRPQTADDFARMAREQTRSSALQALRRPGPAMCGPAERGNLAATLRQYYAARERALRELAINRATDRADDDHAWTTAADKQIDGLVRDFYADGYLQPGDLGSSALVDQILARVAPTSRACAEVKG